MNPARILKKESKQTRKAKKEFNRKIASKKRQKKKKFKKDREKFNLGNRTLLYSSEIESFCKVNNISKWDIEPQIKITINHEISLFENPEQVFRILLRLLHYARFNQTYPSINVESRISFGALYLIDNICWEIAKKRNWTIFLKNIDDNDKSILSKLQSFKSSEYDDDSAFMLNEKVVVNRKDDGFVNQQYKAKSKIITDMIQRAIRENSDPDFILTPMAYQAISSTIGEHFDNILQHAPKAEHGYLCGFYNKQLKEVVILIFNFGETLGQTLKASNLPAEIKAEIDNVIAAHKKKTYWNGKDFTESNALTLLALQEGVSSKLEFDPSRGHGIIDYIEHCFELNADCKISIISGDTAVKIDKNYKMSTIKFLGRERRVLAFNKNNDLYEKPDKQYVKNMPLFFPGVIIETRIPLLYETI